MYRISSLLVFAAAWLCAACSQGDSRGYGKPRQDDATARPVAVQRLDQALGAASVPASMHAAASTYLAMVRQDSASYRNWPAVSAFAPLVEQRIGKMDSVEQALGREYAYLSRELPRAARGATYGVILPYNQSVVLADTLTFVGLNHYLGADCEAYEGFPDYRRRDKELRRLPLDVAHASILTAYPMQGEMPSLLSRMPYEGAVVEALARATAMTPEQVLGYDESQAKWLADNEAKAWQALVTRQMLYATDPAEIEAMMRPAPATAALHAEVPGQAGRWIGHRIVRAYLDRHPETSVAQMLEPKFYANPTPTLSASGYRGE